MLTRWHYIAIGAPLALFALEWRRNRAIVVSLLFAALLFACTQAMVDLRIRAIRESVAFGVSSLDSNDPVRRLFGMLHGLSMMLMALQVVIAAITVWMNARKTVFVETDLVAVPDDASTAAVPYVPPPAPRAVPEAASDMVPPVAPALPPHVVAEEMTEVTVDDIDNTIYMVVVNAEQQYSIWPADREVPQGWTDAGFHGPKSACLTYIEQHWQDPQSPVH